MSSRSGRLRPARTSACCTSWRPHSALVPWPAAWYSCEKVGRVGVQRNGGEAGARDRGRCKQLGGAAGVGSRQTSTYRTGGRRHGPQTLEALHAQKRSLCRTRPACLQQAASHLLVCRLCNGAACHGRGGCRAGILRPQRVPSQQRLQGRIQQAAVSGITSGCGAADGRAASRRHIALCRVAHCQSRWRYSSGRWPDTHVPPTPSIATALACRLESTVGRSDCRCSSL